MEELSASEHHARDAVAEHCSDIGMDTSVYCVCYENSNGFHMQMYKLHVSFLFSHIRL
jgi:hypothetical protein